jgi:hypothetical protein
MTVIEIIDMLRRHVANLQATRTQASQIGDVARVAALDADIAETTTTLAQIESL